MLIFPFEGYYLAEKGEKSDGTPGNYQLDHATLKMIFKSISFILILSLCFSAFVSASDPSITKPIISESGFAVASKSSGSWLDYGEFITCHKVDSERLLRSGVLFDVIFSDSVLSDVDEVKEPGANIDSTRPFSPSRLSSGRYSPFARLAISNSMKDLTDVEGITTPTRISTGLIVEDYEIDH